MPTAFRVLSVRFSFLFKFPGFRSLMLALMLGVPGVALADLTSVPSVVLADGASESFRIEWYCNADECNVLEQQGSTWVSLKNAQSGSGGLYIYRPIGTHAYRLEECWYHHSGDYIIYCSRREPRTVEIKKATPAVPTITAPSSDSDGKYMVEVRGDLSVTSFKVWQKLKGKGLDDPIQGTTPEQLSVPTPSSSSSYKYVRLNLNNSNGSYEYWARACNNAGCSGDSSSRTVNVHIAPGTPPSISVPSLTDGTFTVTWGAGSGETSNYELYRRTGSGSWQIVYNDTSRSTLENVPEGSYTYRVRACYHGKCSPYRTSNTTAAAVPVRTTLNYLPSTNTTGSYTVSWGNVDNRDDFELEERKGSGSWREVSGVSGTSHSFSNNSGTYSYRVRACNALGCANSWSPIKTIDVAVSPSRPSSISVPTSPTDGSFSVSWSYVSGVSRYELERRIDSGSWTNVHGSSSRSYSESPQGQGNYRYRVRACRIVGSAYGCSSWRTSGTVTVAPPANPPTLALSATSGTGDYQFSWTHVDNTTRYVLQENAGNGWVRQNLPTDQTRSFSYAGKGNGTYRYRVRACNAIGCSGFSQTAFIDIALQPGVPGAITVPEAAGSSFNISWGAGSGSVTTYKLERQSGGESALIYAQATPRNFTETALAAGTYTYRVRACRSTRSFENCSGWLTSDSVTVVARPDMPLEGFSALPGENGGVALDWSEVASQITADISYFILEYHIDGGEWVSPYTYKGTDTSFTLPYIAEGEHQFSLRACILVETTEPFELCSDRNLEPPPVAKPSDPPSWDDGLPTSSTDGYYQLSWTHTGDTSWYVVQESFNGGEWTEVATPTEQYHPFENQRSGRYRYRLQACNGFGCSEDTSAEHIVDVALEPDVPTWQSSATYSDGNHEVVWNDLLDDVTHYVLQTSSDNGTSWTEVSNGTALSHAFSDLPAGTYQYRVAAHNNVGEISNQSDWSEVYSVTVAIPQVPSNVRVIDLVQNNFSVVWDSVDNVREYEIQEIIGVVLNTWRVDANTLGVYLADKAENNYAYRIRACNAVGCSEASAPAGVSVAITPGRPGSLTAVAGLQTGLTELFWDTAAGAPDIYEVQQRIGNSGYGASVNYTGLSGIWPEAISQAGIYQYRVRACRSVGSHVGCSGWRSSNVIEYSIPGVPVLHGPEFAPHGIYVVSWIFDGEATEFILEENGVEQYLFTSSITFNEENPRPDGTYIYRVKACNLLDCSDYSLPLTVTVGVVEDDEGEDDGEGEGGGDEGEGEGENPDDPTGVPVPVLASPPAASSTLDAARIVEGEFEVSSTGQAGYTVPIKVAPGSAGLVPTIALRYTSNSGNGIAGLGWALNSGGQVSRCRQTHGADRNALPIQWNSEDRFCLNGQRLLVVSGNYGDVDSTYRTEMDSFARITAMGGTAGHPAYFKVEHKDGIIETYGNAADSPNSRNQLDPSNSTTVAGWSLSTREDSAGNQLIYHYDLDSHGHRLAKITYAYGFNSSPGAEVIFIYEDRDDPLTGYLAGHPSVTKKRLQKIESYADSALFRSYTLAYGEASANTSDDRLSRLSSIEECMGSNCIQKTRFDWEVPEVGFNNEASVMSFNGGVSDHRFGDINGDGLTDVVWYEWAGRAQDVHVDELNPRRWRYALGTVSENGDYSLVPATFDDGAFRSAMESKKRYLNVVDANNDGRMDVIASGLITQFADQAQLHKSVWSNGEWRLAQASTPTIHADHTRRQFKDVDGDGVVDTISWPVDLRPWDPYLYDAVTVSYLKPDSGKSNISADFYSFSAQPIRQHFDGAVNPVPYWEPAEFTQRHLAPIEKLYSIYGDFNGSGRMDVMATAYQRLDQCADDNDEAGCQLSFAKAAIYTTKPVNGALALHFWTEDNVSPGTKDGHVFTDDINGDGLSDLMAKAGSEGWTVSLSNGKELNDPVRVDLLLSFFDYNPGITSTALSDINGDGYNDLVWHSPEEGFTNTSSGTGFGSLLVRYWNPSLEAFESTDILLKSDLGYGLTLNYGDPFRWNASYGRFKTNAINLMDMNGDGKDDLVVTPTGVSGSVHVYLAKPAKASDNKIVAIKRSPTDVIDIEYDQVGTSEHYARGDIIHTGGIPQQCADVATESGGYSDTMCWDVAVGATNLNEFYRNQNAPWHGLAADQQSLQPHEPTFSSLGAMSVVTGVARTAPVANHSGAQRRTAYFYEQARLQASGRGFLGFEYFTEVDRETGLRTRTQYRQDWPYIGRSVLRETFTRHNNKLSEAETTWGVVDCYSYGEPDPDCVENLSQLLESEGSTQLGPLQLFTPEVQQKTWALEDHGASQGILLKDTRITKEVDAKGNTTLESTIVIGSQGEGLTKTVISQYDYTGPTWSMEMGRLERLEVTSSNDSYDPVTRVSSFEYYQSGESVGLLRQETVEPDTDFSLTTTHTYVKGNRTQSSATGSGQTRVTRVEFDSRGRFVDKKYEQITDGNDPNTGSLILMQEVVERDSAGRPTEERVYTGSTSYITKLARYSPFGTRYFTADSTGTYTILDGGKGRGSSGVCPTGTDNWQEVTSAGGGKTLHCHDARGQVLREGSIAFDGNGWNVVDSQYDKLGRTVKKSAPYHYSSGTRYWTSYKLDALGRAYEIQEPHEGSIAVTTIEHEGYDTRTTNAKHQVRVETRDALGQITKVTDPNNGLTQFAYDSRGNMRAMIDPADNRTNVAYDLRDRKVSMTDPDKGSWTYRYNAFDELICQQDGKGQTITNTYDIRGRLISRIDRKAGGNCVTPSGAVEKYTRWTYDTADNGLGQLASVYESASIGGSPLYQRSHSYDAFGRLDTTTTTVPGHQNQSTSHYEKTTYDQYGRVYQQFDAARHSADFVDNGIMNRYNPQGYLSDVVDAQNSSGTHESYYRIDAMDAHGNVTSALYGNGVVQQADYYDDSGLAHILQAHSGGSTVQHLTLDWDEVGNLQSRTEVGSGTWEQLHMRSRNIQEQFTYDGLNRLETWTSSGDITDFAEVSYDGIDNLRSKTGTGDYDYGSECGHTNAGPHAVCRITDGGTNTLYYYDANGNITHDSTGRTLQYAVFDKPLSISRGGHTTTFSYGPERARYKRTDSSGSGVTTTLYAGSVEKIYYPDGKVAWKRHIAGVAVVTQLLATTGDTESTTKHYLHYDHLGSLNLITDEIGFVKEDHYFDPWGDSRAANEPTGTWQDMQPFLKASKPVTSRGFTDHEMLDEVEVIHMNGRIYDAKIGRFMQADPIIQDPLRVQSLNRYSYVWNNPLNATDPSGFETETEVMEEILTKGTKIPPPKPADRKPPVSFIFYQSSGDTSGNAFTYVQIQDGYGNQALFSYDAVAETLENNEDYGQAFMDKLVNKQLEAKGAILYSLAQLSVSAETTEGLGVVRGVGVYGGGIANGVLLATEKAAMLQESGLVALWDGRIRSSKYFGNQSDPADWVRASKAGQFNLARVNRVARTAGNWVTPLNMGVDSYQYVNGDMSTGRFLYNHAGNTAVLALTVSGLGGPAAVLGLGWYAGGELFVPTMQVINHSYEQLTPSSKDASLWGAFNFNFGKNNWTPQK